MRQLELCLASGVGVSAGDGPAGVDDAREEIVRNLHKERDELLAKVKEGRQRLLSEGEGLRGKLADKDADVMMAKQAQRTAEMALSELKQRLERAQADGEQSRTEADARQAVVEEQVVALRAQLATAQSAANSGISDKAPPAVTTVTSHLGHPLLRSSDKARRPPLRP